MDKQNITSSELKKLYDHKFAHNISHMDKKYFYEEEEFSPDTKKKDINKEYLEYVNNSEYIGTVEVKGKKDGKEWCPGRFGYELPNKDSRGG